MVRSVAEDDDRHSIDRLLAVMQEADPFLPYVAAVGEVQRDLVALSSQIREAGLTDSQIDRLEQRLEALMASAYRTGAKAQSKKRIRDYAWAWIVLMAIESGLSAIGGMALGVWYVQGHL